MKHIGALKKHKHIILPEMAVKQFVFTFADMDIIIKTRHSQQYIFYDGAFGWSKTLKQQVIDENISLSYISRYKIGRGRKQPFFLLNWFPALVLFFYNYVFASNDTTWLNAANPHWNNGIPTATKNAIIETSYDTATYGNFESNNLTINPGGTLTVNAGGYITINGQIANKNTATGSFVIEHNANLLQKNNYRLL